MKRFKSFFLCQFPQKTDIEEAIKEAGTEYLRPLLEWLSCDPYQDDPEIRRWIDYKEAVQYAKELIL